MSDLRGILGDKYADVMLRAMSAVASQPHNKPYTMLERVADTLAAVLPDLLAEANTRAEDAEAKARRFANMLANYNNEINATLPAEVVRQKAAAWDECTRAWEAYPSGTSDNVPPLNPYRQEQ